MRGPGRARRMPAMSRAEDLAAEVERTYAEFADYVESLSPEEWQAPAVNSPTIHGGPDESRTVGVVAHHVGDMLPMLAERVRRLAAEGQIPALTQADLDSINAMHAAANPTPTQAETAAMIRDNASHAATIIRELGDEALAREGATGAGRVSVERAIRRVLIGHAPWHLESIRATVGR
jgi:DinB superfamily